MAALQLGMPPKVLDTDASACLTCAHQDCLGAYPYGIPPPAFTRDAAARLG